MKKSRIEALQKEIIKNLSIVAPGGLERYGTPYTRNGETMATDLHRIFIVQTPGVPESPERKDFPKYRKIFPKKKKYSGVVFDPGAAFELMRDALKNKYTKDKIVRCHVGVDGSTLIVAVIKEVTVDPKKSGAYLRRVIRIPCTIEGNETPHCDISGRYLLSCLGAFREEKALCWEQEEGLCPHLFHVEGAELSIMPLRP